MTSVTYDSSSAKSLRLIPLARSLTTCLIPCAAYSRTRDSSIVTVTYSPRRRVTGTWKVTVFIVDSIRPARRTPVRLVNRPCPHHTPFPGRVHVTTCRTLFVGRSSPNKKCAYIIAGMIIELREPRSSSTHISLNAVHAQYSCWHDN